MSLETATLAGCEERSGRFFPEAGGSIAAFDLAER